MPMLPKPPGTARRRGATPWRILAPAPDPAPSRPPRLPADRDWHAHTRRWWSDAWSSPMAAEWLPSDRHGLLMLALLVDTFWAAEDSKTRVSLLAEIRLQSQCYGLSPIDRRRLSWAVDRGDQAERRTQQRRIPTKVAGPDPRAALSGPDAS